MIQRSPAALMEALVAARSAGDIDAAAAFYEPNAIVVSQPGQVLHGMAGVRERLEFIGRFSSTASVESREILVAGDLALHLSRWKVSGTDPYGEPFEVSGESSDVLRRQSNGGWLMSIENPWGSAILF